MPEKPIKPASERPSFSEQAQVPERPSSPERPHFPKRAVVTAGMPYGNKGLHFGHIGGVFIPADVFARFLRDRIGSDNVLFVSGTDCYGSPINEGYRKLVEAGDFTGSIRDYVQINHEAQIYSLKAYDISLDIYEGSGLGKSQAVHEQMTDRVIRQLHKNGYLKLIATEQFYDEQAESFLNGRQVTGHCPISGCKSEQAYADECDLGHQYQPRDLITPVSNLSGTVPVMRAVSNWYLDISKFHTLLKDYVSQLVSDEQTRKVVSETMAEFLADPIIYVRDELLPLYSEIAAQLPEHRFLPIEKGKQSFGLAFSDLDARDSARILLDEAGIRYRTGKTLVPFRITGNIDWGVPAPYLEGEDEARTVWCWPESLWAPISFCATWLENQGRGIESLNPREAEADAVGDEGADAAATGTADATADATTAAAATADAAATGAASAATADAATAGTGAATTPTAGAAAAAAAAPTPWQSFWCDTEAEVFQFIGQDNIYFYGIAQTALFAALPETHAPWLKRVNGELLQTHLIANYHLLFLNKKASSSAAIKPPMADELLNYYTAEQLRAHFISLGLAIKPVSFQPKALNPQAQEKDADPVLKEGQLLTGVLNRLARSCFYEAQNNFSGELPKLAVTAEIQDKAAAAILEYERLMHAHELHAVMQHAAEFIRMANKYWSDAIRIADSDSAERKQVLADSLHLLRACLMLMHPIVPSGVNRVFKQLALPVAECEFFSWRHVDERGYLDDWSVFLGDEEKASGSPHVFNELPPRFDFFERHPSQV